MGEYPPNIVARLVALNERTRKAWAHPYNKPFYVPPSFQGFQICDGTSRESTPLDEDGDNNGHVEESEPEIRILFDSRPRNISKGWTFGSDQNVCDIYCGEYDKKNRYNIGRQTFSITFNKQGDVILKHVNENNRTMVQYDIQKAGDRREFTWIMLPSCKTIVVTVAKHLKFLIIVAKPGTQTNTYKSFRAQFLKGVEDSMPSIPGDTSLVPTPKAQPFYYRCEDRKLGSGSFGQVYVVVDVSTGIEYAGKTFFGAFNQSEANILAKQSHENILEYVTLSQDDGPLLVTGYLKGGNLCRPWRLKDRAPWQIFQIVSILTQCLRGLATLHASPNPVIHRDIKPENILVDDRERVVEPREPGPWIKLADFGLATECTRCEGSAGTWLYSAPETFYSQPYSSKVDIWSLGVVILQLLLEGRIPEPTRGYVQGPQWCMDINELAIINHFICHEEDKLHLGENDWSMRTMLWGFIADAMLHLNSEQRRSARECLEHPILWTLQSRMRTWAEAQRKNTGQQSSGILPVSTAAGPFAFGDGAVVPEHELPANKPHVLPAAYDPGVEEAVALKNQGSKGSKTAMPQASRPNNPQPLPYGLVLAGDHDPALTQVGKSKARATAKVG